MSLELEVDLPSGARLLMRGMQIGEAARFAAKQADVSLFHDLIKACTIKVLDSGPYKGEFTWSKALAGDLIYGTISVRIITWGKDYEFSYLCPHCQRMSAAFVDLADDGDLLIEDLNEEGRALFAAGNRFEGVWPGTGKKYWYHHPTGADDVRSAKLRKQIKNPLVVLLGTLIDEIEGVHENDLLREIASIDLATACIIQDDLDEYNCGVDTNVDLVCEHCESKAVGHTVPFGGVFFRPKAKKAKKTKHRRSART